MKYTGQIKGFTVTKSCRDKTVTYSEHITKKPDDCQAKKPSHNIGFLELTPIKRPCNLYVGIKELTFTTLMKEPFRFGQKEKVAEEDRDEK